MSDYDMSIHSNPDAAAWARFFKETCDKLGKECDEGWMLGWFANAMMAAHDHAIKTAEARAERAEADAERRRRDRAMVLDVKTTDGLSASEWLMRTARAEARVREVESLLREVLPDTMGGYPDLFGPSAGWDAWEERALAALASASPAPEPGITCSCAASTPERTYVWCPVHGEHPESILARLVAEHDARAKTQKDLSDATGRAAAYRLALEVLAEEARGFMATDPTKAPVHLLSLAEFAERYAKDPIRAATDDVTRNAKENGRG